MEFEYYPGSEVLDSEDLPENMFYSESETTPSAESSLDGSSSGMSGCR